MYADDSVMLAENEAGICKAVNGMEMYYDAWRSDINCKKTKITIFTKTKSEADNYNYRFKGEKIEIIEEYKYLGAVMNYNGSFKACQEQLA